jgi:hypothetical protein
LNEEGTKHHCSGECQYKKPHFQVAALVLIALAGVAASGQRTSGPPDCTGANRWPATMALVQSKNSGLTDTNKVDLDKTKVTRLASEQIGRDLYRQVHLVTFTEKSGAVIEVITVNNASHQECSESDVEVYVVSKRLGSSPGRPR